jgi:hypothetical protein
MQQEYPVTESIATKEATYSKASMFVNYWDRQDHHNDWDKIQLNPLLTYNAPLDIFQFTPLIYNNMVSLLPYFLLLHLP